MELGPQRAVIIGASSGIGRALAKELAKAGYWVGLTGRRVELLESLKVELPSKGFVKKIDVRAPEEAIPAVQQLIREMGGLDLMIVNAGIDLPNPTLDWKVYDEIFKVNILGFMAMCHVAINQFKIQQHGHLVGISSIAGIRGNGSSPAYAASKAFVSNYLEGIRQRISSPPIYVTDIRPGFVDTPLTEGKNLTFWLASAETAACQICQAIQKKDRVAYVTRRWQLIAWILRMLPGWLHDRLAKRVIGI